VHVQQFDYYFMVTVEVLGLKSEEDRSLEFW
jgi:hypothetical protein